MVRVVARCSQLDHIEKLKRAGADAVVSPTFIGGLRMASEMVRPNQSSLFLGRNVERQRKKVTVQPLDVKKHYAAIGISLFFCSVSKDGVGRL